MSLDKATVARIAMLARIEVPEAQQERLAGELSQIIGWIEQLGEVDTDGVEPMRSVMPITTALARGRGDRRRPARRHPAQRAQAA